MVSKVLKSFGGFIASTISFVVYIVSRFVKVIALIAIGAIAIFFTALLISGHFGLPYITMITPDPAVSGYIGFYAGITAFLIIPLIALIRLGVSYIWRYKRNPKFRYAIASVWIVSFMIFALTAIFTARNFLYETAVTETISEAHADPDRPLHIELAKTQNSNKMKIQFGDDTFLSDGRFYNDDIKVDFVPSEDDKVRVVRTTYSRGLNNRAAKRNAYYPSHHVSLKDNQLSLDDYYTISNTDKYRSQSYSYKVSIPQGTELALNRRSKIFRDRSLRKGKGDVKSEKWTMTEQGLELVKEG